MGEDSLLAAPQPPTHQVFIFGGWKLLESVDAAVDSNPVALIDVEMLVRVVVAEFLGVGRREVPLLGLRHLEQVMGFHRPAFHAKTLH